MGIIDKLLQVAVSRPKQKRERSPLSTDERTLRGQISTQFVRKFLDGADPKEMTKIGRQIALRLVGGSNVDPMAVIVAEAMEDDPEFRQRAKDVWLEKQEVELEDARARVARRRGGDDDDEFLSLAKERLLEEIVHPKGSGLLDSLAPALAAAFGPGGALTRLLVPLPQGSPQPQGALPVPSSNSEVVYQDGERTDVPQADQTQAQTPLLFDVFTPSDVGEIFVLDTAEWQAREAWSRVQAVLQTKSSIGDRMRIIAYIQAMTNMEYKVIMMLLEELKQYEGWRPIVVYIGEHETEFTAFCEALATVMEGGSEPTEQQE